MQELVRQCGVTNHALFWSANNLYQRHFMGSLPLAPLYLLGPNRFFSGPIGSNIDTQDREGSIIKNRKQYFTGFYFCS